jgi:hypothetical protein
VEQGERVDVGVSMSLVRQTAGTRPGSFFSPLMFSRAGGEERLRSSSLLETDKETTIIIKTIILTIMMMTMIIIVSGQASD